MLIAERRNSGNKSTKHDINDKKYSEIEQKTCIFLVRRYIGRL